MKSFQHSWTHPYMNSQVPQIKNNVYLIYVQYTDGLAWLTVHDRSVLIRGRHLCLEPKGISLRIGELNGE